MKNISKNNNNLKQKKKSYFKLSDEQVIANFLQTESLSGKTINRVKDTKQSLIKGKEESVSQDTMAYRINKSGFFLELLKEKEDSLQLVGN